jgi:hypothetical protein
MAKVPYFSYLSKKTQENQFASKSSFMRLAWFYGKHPSWLREAEVEVCCTEDCLVPAE